MRGARKRIAGAKDRVGAAVIVTAAHLALVGSLVGLLLGASGCRPPTQYGGPIAVDTADLASRLRVACQAGLVEPSAPGSASASGTACGNPARPTETPTETADETQDETPRGKVP